MTATQPSGQADLPQAGPKPPDEQWRTEVALFRYTLILPLLRHDRQRDGTKCQIREAIAAQQHVIPHSERCTISVPTLRRWEKDYLAGGFDALKPKPRSDRGASRALSAETLERAEALKRELPSRSTRAVVDILKRDAASPVAEECIAPRTLSRQLAARGATTVRLTKARPVFRRFERSHFGDLWQSDAMHGPKLPDPTNPAQERATILFAFLDDHTRLVPHAQFYWNEQLPRLEDCLKRGIMRYGRPLAIYVDQGPSFRAEQLDVACASLGIQRILAKPYSPQAKGKIERFFGFVRSDFLPELALAAAIHTLDALNLSFLAWLEVVYHRKLHTETGQSPLDRFRGDEAPTVRPADPLTLRQAFLFRVQRQVTKTGHVNFQGNRYSVPGYLIGEKVELRYDPFDLADVEIWYNGHYLEQARPLQIQTTVQPGLTLDPVPPQAAPSTGVDYLAMLRQEYEQLLREQLPPIPFKRFAADSEPSDSGL
jgi:putative transposase